MLEIREGPRARTRWLAPLAAAAMAAATAGGGPAAQTLPLDLVLRGARIVDGTGTPWYRGDVGIRGDTIARLAPSIDEPAARTIDIAGAVVAPGFIDIHTHAARGILDRLLSPPFDDYTDLLLSSVPEMEVGWLEKVLKTRRMASAGN